MTMSPQIVTKFYDFLLYLIPQISKFPRSERYLLGERLESVSFEIFELLLTAVYSRDKISFLQKTNIKLEQVRQYVRLSKDLRFISLHRYEVISKMTNEIGLQLGGWLKQQRGKDEKVQAPLR